MQNKKQQQQVGYPPDFELAQAYIPFQIYNQRYGLQEGLKKGTIFPELYDPYQRKK